MPNVVTLDMNTTSVQYLCSKDKRLAKVISMVGPISYVPHEEDTYSFLIHEIIEQMLSVKAGQKIYGRLEDLCDGMVTLERIAALNDDEIRGTGTSSSKVRCIRSVTEAVLCGDLDFNKMDMLSDEEVICALGFCHRPEFQFLCKPCNSAKNNRMYYTDVLHLIEVEKGGETVATWYADPIWQKCKGKVTDKESALRLSRVMRDNRNVAMMLLADFIDRNEFLFLFTLLNLEYADYDYDIIPGTTKISHQIVTVDFSQKASTLRYVNIQKTRKIRVAFSSLSEYAKKENRNGYTYTNAKIEALKKQAFIILSNINSNMKKLNASLIAALSDEERIDAEIEAFLSSVDYTALKRTQEFIDVKELLKQIMELVAQELSSNWDDPRYSRETADE